MTEDGADLDKIRASSGTLMELGLKSGEALEKPTTAYLMIPGGTCRGGCTYCPQSSGDSKWLSRVSWPLHDTEEVIEKLKDNDDLKRICLQSPDIESYEEKIVEAVDRLKRAGKPISLSVPPLKKDVITSVKKDVDRIGVGIDAVSDDLRKKTKPNYDPAVFWDFMGDALDVLGDKKVTAHLMVGLGENLEEVGFAVNRVLKSGGTVSLFPYMTKEEQVDLRYYRKSQLLTALLEKEHTLDEALQIVQNRPSEALDSIEKGDTFCTQGCPGCNRPFYTTRPGHEHRNFPRVPDEEEVKEIKRELDITEEVSR